MNKYKNKKVYFLGGEIYPYTKKEEVPVNAEAFDSMLELEYYIELMKLEARYPIRTIRQHKMTMTENIYLEGKKLRDNHYIADYLVTIGKFKTAIIDVKGMVTPRYALLRAIFLDKVKNKKDLRFYEIRKAPLYLSKIFYVKWITITAFKELKKMHITLKEEDFVKAAKEKARVVEELGLICLKEGTYEYRKEK